MSTTSIYDITINQGSDFLDSLDMSGDYTGYTIAGKILDPIGILSSNFVTWTNDTLGQFDMSISNTVTASMTSGVGSYDIKLTSPLGVVSKIFKGRVYIDKEITV